VAKVAVEVSVIIVVVVAIVRTVKEKEFGMK
jgi:hypothetical protein